jgi:hypothetical protein
MSLLHALLLLLRLPFGLEGCLLLTGLLEVCYLLVGKRCLFLRAVCC